MIFYHIKMIWVHKTNLAPPPFEIPVPRLESGYVKDIEFSSVSAIFLFICGIVPTMSYVLCFVLLHKALKDIYPVLLLQLDL